LYAFKHQTGYFGGRVPNNVQKGYDIRSSREILQDLDLALDLLLLDGLQDLYDTFLVGTNVYSLKYLYVCRNL
jgi:hypothetical protein